MTSAGRRDSWRAACRAGASAGWRRWKTGTEALHNDVGAWLEQNLVPDGPPGLLHNDFKLNNIILDPDDFSPRAVVDWDQGTRGDPLFDFATLLTYWIHEDDPWAMHDMEQMPAVEACLCSRQEAVAEYARLSGRDMSDFLFHRVLAMYKLSVIFLQLGLRYRSGATQEPRYAPLTGDRHRHSGIHPRNRPRTRILTVWLGVSRPFPATRGSPNGFFPHSRTAGVAAAHTGFHPRQDHSAGRRWAADASWPDRRIPSRTGRAGRGRGPGGAACRGRIRRAGAVACRQGGGVRGSRIFAAGPGGDAHLRAG